MPSSRKIVVRFNFWSDPAMEERFAREPDIELRTCDVRGPENDAWSDLAEAHVYQISAARDELPPQWFATAALLERCPRLLCVSSTGAGYDTVDTAACTRAGVLAVNQVGANAQSVAEHTIALMLDVSRRISEGDRLLRRERGFAREDIMGREMSGKVVGLVGIGHIGSRVAGLARAFGMTVLAFDPYLTEEEIARRGAVSVAMSELLERSDFVSLHCPRDDSTRRMMDAGAFARMKKGAVFVTTARGGIHDEAGVAQRAPVRASARRRHRCVGQGAAAARPSAARAGERRRVLPYRRRDPRGAAQHVGAGRGADRRHLEGRTTAAPGQSRGLAGLRQAVRGGPEFARAAREPWSGAVQRASASPT